MANLTNDEEQELIAALAECETLEPSILVPPGRLINDERKARRWSIEKLASRGGIDIAELKEIIFNGAPMNKNTAIAVDKAFGFDFELFPRIEATYRERLARRQGSTKLDS